MISAELRFSIRWNYEGMKNKKCREIGEHKSFHININDFFISHQILIHKPNTTTVALIAGKDTKSAKSVNDLISYRKLSQQENARRKLQNIGVLERVICGEIISHFLCRSINRKRVKVSSKESNSINIFAFLSVSRIFAQENTHSRYVSVALGNRF